MMEKIFFRAGLAGLILILSACHTYEESRIQPYSENPFYWQYEGKPLMLVGASKDDNLFQQKQLKEHLRDIKQRGGNYIRNTMSSRDVGGGNEVLAFLQNETGKYDLNIPNPEYWNRLDSLLKWTGELDIIVQIEIWATHDHFPGKRWQENPWNPKNNVNYNYGNSTLQAVIPERPGKKHPFFNSVPGANNDTLLLNYQEKFVKQLLERSLQHDHVLYCITNEIQHAQSQEWSWYWASFLRTYAREKGKGIELTEMYWAPDMKDNQHKLSLDHPDYFTFFEASQNSAISGQENWDNLEYVMNYLKDSPRPVNSVKIYGKTAEVSWPGTDDEAVDRFWRHFLGGCAAVRFHRNENGIFGLGFSELSISSLKAANWLLERIQPWEAWQCMELLSDREANEVYAFRDKESICLYFPGEATIKLNLNGFQKEPKIEWYNVESGETRTGEMEYHDEVEIQSPGARHWLCVIR